MTTAVTDNIETMRCLYVVIINRTSIGNKSHTTAITEGPHSNSLTA